MSKVTVHSEGMVSVDASNVKVNRAAVEFLKGTHLYRQIVTSVGEPQAQQIIDGTADLSQISDPAKPNQIA